MLLLILTAVLISHVVQGCSDKERYKASCLKWKPYCSPDSKYYSFMETNCQKTCSFCKVEETEICEDSEKYASNCQSLKESNRCKKGQVYYEPMKKYCPKTCEFCKAACVDDAKFENRCDSFKASGYCKENQVYYESMKKFCPKTCQLCNSNVNNQQCSNGPKHKGRVVGGHEALANSWPWQVGLLYKDKLDCGGTLIAPQWVMTAGHCVVGRNIENMLAVLGEHDWTQKSGYEQDRRIMRIFKYPNYNVEDNINDIALLKLDREVKLNKQVQTACLPNDKEESKDGQCYITGWGYTNGYATETSPTLQEVKLPVADRADCSKLNFQVGSGLKLGAGQLCAGYGADYSKVQTGCRGDSGGPLACKYGIRWTVDGVVSFGSSRCFGFEKYTVFTKVSHYVNWINQVMDRYKK